MPLKRHHSLREANAHPHFCQFAPGHTLSPQRFFSLAGYAKVDLGIVKCHFEIAAVKENFKWK